MKTNILTILMVSILILGCDEKEENNQDIYEKKAFIESVNLPDSIPCCSTVDFSIKYGLPNLCYEFSRITKLNKNKHIKYTVLIKNENYYNSNVVCPTQYKIDSIQLEFKFQENGKYIFNFNDSAKIKEVIIY